MTEAERREAARRAAAQRRRAEEEARASQNRANEQRAQAEREAAQAGRVQAEGESAARRLTAEQAAATAAAEAARLTAETNARLRREQEEQDRARRAEDEERRNRESGNTASARSYQVAMNIAFPVAGAYIGHRLAKHLEGRHVRALQAQTNQIYSLGQQANTLLRANPQRAHEVRAHNSRLRGVVATADRMGLRNVRGPIGLVTAGLLLGEGAFSRFVLADQVESQAAKDALRATGTASAFAATNLLGERLVQNRTLAKLPSAPAYAHIEAARAHLAGAGRGPATTVATATPRPSLSSGFRATVNAALTSPRAAAARRVLPAAVRVGGVAGGIAALGYIASQTTAGQQAYQYVRGFFRTNPSGTTSYVDPHRRRNS